MRIAVTLSLSLLFVVASSAQQRLIYDDDCSQDVDCVVTLPILYALHDRGEIHILAMVADSANPLSAPVMRVFADHEKHPEMLIGANQTDAPTTARCKTDACNGSVWTKRLVSRFDPGDSRAKYADCVQVYRQTLAAQPDHSVAVVATGFATCLNQLLASRPDAISSLSGIDLIRRKVKLLSVMGGQYPQGTEWNFKCDAPDFHELFSVWTRQNGYPPIYLNGFANGLHVLAGAPATELPTANPTRYGLLLADTNQRPMWDALSVLFAARGTTLDGKKYFRLSMPGTVIVDGVTGADRWFASSDSGAYVLTNAASDETYEALFDGYAHTSGFLTRAKK